MSAINDNLFPSVWLGSVRYPVCRHCGQSQKWTLIHKCTTCNCAKCVKNCPGGENLPCTHADVYI